MIATGWCSLVVVFILGNCFSFFLLFFDRSEWKSIVGDLLARWATSDCRVIEMKEGGRIKTERERKKEKESQRGRERQREKEKEKKN